MSEYCKSCFELQNKIDKLKAENDRLKEEIEIRDNLSEKFRKEALSWANIANEYQKDKTKLNQNLQEIKAIVKDNIIGFFCDLADEIQQKITKAEEE